ncbi:MAG TPA: hypothetical protein DCW33_03940 [Proteobacteria bacterium]|nr:hypothetical protein [Pseudomonadota bacterium]
MSIVNVFADISTWLKFESDYLYNGITMCNGQGSVNLAAQYKHTSTASLLFSARTIDFPFDAPSDHVHILEFVSLLQLGSVPASGYPYLTVVPKLLKGHQSHNIAFVFHSYYGEDTPGSWSGSGVGDSKPDIWTEVIAAYFYGMGRDLVAVSQIAISNDGFLNTGKSIVPSVGVNGDLMFRWSYTTELFYVYLDSVGDKMPGSTRRFYGDQTRYAGAQAVINYDTDDGMRFSVLYSKVGANVAGDFGDLALRLSYKL